MKHPVNKFIFFLQDLYQIATKYLLKTIPQDPRSPGTVGAVDRTPIVVLAPRDGDTPLRWAHTWSAHLVPDTWYTWCLTPSA